MLRNVAGQRVLAICHTLLTPCATVTSGVFKMVYMHLKQRQLQKVCTACTVAVSYRAMDTHLLGVVALRSWHSIPTRHGFTSSR